MSQRHERFIRPSWGLLWHSKTRLGGVCEHMIYEDGQPCFFKTRNKARGYAQQKYGYIRSRRDLRQEPHGWRLPRPVKILGLILEGAREGRG